jgi:hypothetical protein
VKRNAFLVFFFIFSSYFLWGFDLQTGVDLVADPVPSSSEANEGLSNTLALETDNPSGTPEEDRDRACQGICGDANYDGTITVTDLVWIINAIFNGDDPPQPVTACGDANSDARVNVSDACYIVVYIFQGGPSPGDCSPGAWAGNDCCPY